MEIMVKNLYCEGLDVIKADNVVSVLLLGRLKGATVL